MLKITKNEHQFPTAGFSFRELHTSLDHRNQEKRYCSSYFVVLLNPFNLQKGLRKALAMFVIMVWVYLRVSLQSQYVECPSVDSMHHRPKALAMTPTWTRFFGSTIPFFAVLQTLH